MTNKIAIYAVRISTIHVLFISLKNERRKGEEEEEKKRLKQPTSRQPPGNYVTYQHIFQKVK